jgi:hypothetical protein
MKCPKCGYHGFEHLDNCKKCGQDLSEHKAKFSLKGFYSPGQTAIVETPEPAAAEESDEAPEPSEDGSVDFGFDFLEEDDPLADAPDSVPLGDDDQDVSIDQPFSVDSETVPADEPAVAEDNDSDDKPDKGPEFAF